MKSNEKSLGWLSFKELGDGFFSQEVVLNLNKDSKLCPPLLELSPDFEGDIIYLSKSQDMFKFYDFLSQEDMEDLHDMFLDENYMINLTIGSFTLNEDGKLIKLDTPTDKYVTLDDVTDVVPYLNKNKNDIVRVNCNTNVITSPELYDHSLLYSIALDMSKLSDLYIVKFLYNAESNSIKLTTATNLLDGSEIKLSDPKYKYVVEQCQSELNLQFFSVYNVYKAICAVNDDVGLSYESIQQNALDTLSKEEIEALNLKIANELYDKGYDSTFDEENPLKTFELTHPEVEMMFEEYLEGLQK